MTVYYCHIGLCNGVVFAHLWRDHSSGRKETLYHKKFHGLFVNPPVETQYKKAVKWMEELMRVVAIYEDVKDFERNWSKP